MPRRFVPAATASNQPRPVRRCRAWLVRVWHRRAALRGVARRGGGVGGAGRFVVTGPASRRGGEQPAAACPAVPGLFGVCSAPRGRVAGGCAPWRRSGRRRPVYGRRACVPPRRRSASCGLSGGAGPGWCGCGTAGPRCGGCAVAAEWGCAGRSAVRVSSSRRSRGERPGTRSPPSARHRRATSPRRSRTGASGYAAPAGRGSSSGRPPDGRRARTARRSWSDVSSSYGSGVAGTCSRCTGPVPRRA